MRQNVFGTGFESRSQKQTYYLLLITYYLIQTALGWKVKYPNLLRRIWGFQLTGSMQGRFYSSFELLCFIRQCLNQQARIGLTQRPQADIHLLSTYIYLRQTRFVLVLLHRIGSLLVSQVRQRPFVFYQTQTRYPSPP